MIDMDTLVFGDAPILRYFFSRGRPILSIDPIIARNDLGLSRESFMDLCILCGTDFSGTIQGIGPHRALQWIQKYGSIEEILNNLGETGYAPQPMFNYKLARLVFNDLPPIPSHDSDYDAPETNQSQIDDLLKYYEIDPVDAEVKLKTTLLTQNIIDTNNWGTNPFASNNNNNLDLGLLQSN
jgi:5'-3' exonuclease